MCNCAGNVQFSNCAGNPDCNCDQAGFNNMVGMNGFSGAYSTNSRSSNATGEIQTLSTPSIQIQTTLPTIKPPVVTTTAPTTSTNTSGQTLNKVLDLGSSVLGLFGKKPAATSAPVYIPEEEKTIPMAVWVVAGGLLVLVIAFFIVKASKK